MDSKEFAKKMIDDVQALEASGRSSVLCSGLVTYLNQHILATPDSNPEIEKIRHEEGLKIWIAQQDRDHQANLEMFRSVIMAGQSALKTGFLLNGGASVAMLAYIGQHGGDNTPAFAHGLMWFVWGTLLISISTALTYLTQRAYGAGYEGKWWCKVLNGLTIFSGFMSLVLFIVGMYSVYDVFLTM